MFGDYARLGHLHANSYECCKGCGRPYAKAKEFNGVELTASGLQFGGGHVRLTMRERQLYELLARTPGEPIHRDRIYSAFYGEDTTADPKIIDVYVYKLRKKLAAFPVEIATQFATGYFLRARAVGN